MAVTAAGLLAGYGLIRIFFDPAVDAIEAVDPTKAGFPSFSPGLPGACWPRHG